MAIKQLLANLTFTLAVIFTLNAQTPVESIYVENELRTYRIFIPSHLQNEQNLPVVFNFHGFGSNAAQQEVYTIMDTTAVQNNFIVVYPEGIDNAWNVGFLGTSSSDIAFTEKIIDQLYFDYQIDLSKVYSCGMSNGGYFSYRLACEIPERFAAIASVTGSMLNSEIVNCTTNNKMPVLQIHGTDDDAVLYDGDAFSSGIENLMDFWAAKNACDTSFTIEMIADIDTTDDSTAEKITYQNCDASVQLYKIYNGTHTWPDALLNLTGVTNKDINASNVIWDFFKDFSIENPVVPSSTAIQNNFSEFNVSPNPFKNQLLIVNNQFISEIKIYDVAMNLVKKVNNLQSNAQQINTSNLLNGIYFIEIKSNKTTEIVKLVKM